MTSAISAFGIKLKIGDGATPTEAFTTVPENKDMSGPSRERDTVEVSSHSSTSGVKEYIKGMVDMGEINFTINYVPANTVHKGLIADWLSGVTRNWRLVYPFTGATGTENAMPFSGLVTKFEESAPIDDALTADVTIKITGVSGTWVVDNT